MKTIIEDMTKEISTAGMARAGAILKAGGLVAFPTETVYGLGANALDEQAAAKIYRAKGRPSDNPLIIHIAVKEALSQIAAEIPPEALLLADAFWPGPLTMIFRKTAIVPGGTTGGLDTVAVRIPDHEIARALIECGGGYIAAPSANVSGRPSPTEAKHVAEDLAGKIEMIIDGGSVGIGLESTIVDMTEQVPVILRPGFINQEMIEAVIGPVKMDRGLAPQSQTAPKAPGMKYRHYAPAAKMVIVTGETPRVVDKINQLTAAHAAKGEQVGIIATDETVDCYRGGVVKTLGSIHDEQSIARHLYGILREFDRSEVAAIYSEAFQTPRMGHAIMNRLVKAAGHQILKV